MQAAAGREIHPDPAQCLADPLADIDEIKQIERPRVGLVQEQIDIRVCRGLAACGRAKQIKRRDADGAQLRLSRAKRSENRVTVGRGARRFIVHPLQDTTVGAPHGRAKLPGNGTARHPRIRCYCRRRL